MSIKSTLDNPRAAKLSFTTAVVAGPSRPPVADVKEGAFRHKCKH